MSLLESLVRPAESYICKPFCPFAIVESRLENFNSVLLQYWDNIAISIGPSTKIYESVNFKFKFKYKIKSRCVSSQLLRTADDTVSWRKSMSLPDQFRDTLITPTTTTQVMADHPTPQ